MADARAADAAGAPPGDWQAGSSGRHPEDHRQPDPAEDWDDERDDNEPDHACDLNVWLKDNWDTLHALARAQQLPEIAPPRPEGADDADTYDADAADPFAFDPVPLQARLDGWSAERQVAFIEVLAESACVAAACRAVKMSKQSAYALRARPDAISFRNAWDKATDFATRRLADVALSRAVNGVATPIFFQGEQVGERRTYDERLTMFLLQRRDPLRFGSWRDKGEWKGHPEGQAIALVKAKAATREDAEMGSSDIAERLSRRLGEIVGWMRGQARMERQQERN